MTDVKQEAVVPQQPTVQQLATHIIEWHYESLTLAQQIMEVPLGTTVTYNDSEGVNKEFDLDTEELRVAFQAGCVAVADSFRNLPIKASPIDA